MKELKKIGLFIDLSKMDLLLLDYVKNLNIISDFGRLTLIHFVPLEEISKEIGDMLPYLDKSLNDILREEAMDKVEEVFGERKDTIEVNIFSNAPLDHLIDWVDDQKFDLLLLGKKAIHGGTGIFSSKVVRLNGSTTLFVPERAKPSVKKLVVPLDFSEVSEKIILLAISLAQKTGAEWIPVHVLKMGMQYFPYIRKSSEFQANLQAKALSNFEKLKKKTGIPQELVIIEEQEAPASRSIYDFAVKIGADLIIVGNKGKTNDDNLLIGSVPEGLIAADKHLPVIIVK